MCLHFYGLQALVKWRIILKQSTPVFLPGKSHGQRSLVGYSPWDHEELDVTENKCASHSLMAHQETM